MLKCPELILRSLQSHLRSFQRLHFHQEARAAGSASTANSSRWIVYIPLYCDRAKADLRVEGHGFGRFGIIANEGVSKHIGHRSGDFTIVANKAKSKLRLAFGYARRSIQFLDIVRVDSESKRMDSTYLGGRLEGTDLVERNKRNAFSELAFAEQLTTNVLVVDDDVVEATTGGDLKRR